MSTHPPDADADVDANDDEESDVTTTSRGILIRMPPSC